MDSPESNTSPDDPKPLVGRRPPKMSWAQAMRLLEPSRQEYMRKFDSPEKRSRDKNPAPFILP